jgi:uncharacterized protein YndB with AHSA1/START domain
MTDTATRSLVVERDMPHPPEKIWRALTLAPLIEDWMMANDFEPVVGHRFTLRAPPQPHWNGIIDCEVIAVEPPALLAYRWNGTDDAVDGLRTIVTWTLTPSAGGTHVRMEQTGFRAQDQSNFKGAGHGWRRFIAALEASVAGLD